MKERELKKVINNLINLREKAMRKGWTGYYISSSVGWDYYINYNSMVLRLAQLLCKDKQVNDEIIVCSVNGDKTINFKQFISILNG